MTTAAIIDSQSVKTNDAIVEDRSLRQIGRTMKLRDGTATGHLKLGLQRYAEIARWLPVERTGKKS